MVNFLVRAADFLAFAMRLVSEDIIWLKDYCSYAETISLIFIKRLNVDLSCSSSFMLM